MKAKEPNFVIVEWFDAWADNEEFVKHDKVDENHKPAVIKTAGWLLVDDDKGISLFNERAPEENCWRGRTFIPKGMIVSVTPYRLSKPRLAKRPVDPDNAPN